MPSYSSDPHHEERARLAAEPGLDPRGRDLVLDPAVRIADAREIVAIAKRLAAGYRKQGFGAFDSSNKAQAMRLKMGTAHVTDGGVQFDGIRQVLGAQVVRS